METNIYCIVLNIAQGIGFSSTNCLGTGVILEVSLNEAKFDVHGKLSQKDVITFNSNCIWECELDDIKRIKKDNRPLKVECVLHSDCNGNGPANSHVGSLLLPLRGVKTLSSLEHFQVKQSWYKLNNLNSDYRQSTPQLLLMLSIVKKTIVDHINMEVLLNNHQTSLTDSNIISPKLTNTITSMLQPQHGIFIKLLEDVGQIQVGNDPYQDCDIFLVTLTFKQIRNILPLLNFDETATEVNRKSLVFQYNFLGSISSKEITRDTRDCFTINQKISLCFRSSLKSLRVYFQRVFFIPIHLYYINEIAIAKFNLDCSSSLPEHIQTCREKEPYVWTKTGSFYFDILNKIRSPSTLKPSVEFLFTLELLRQNVNEQQSDKRSRASELKSYTTRHDTTDQKIQIERDLFVKEYLHLQQGQIASYSLYSEANNEDETHRKSVPNKSVSTVAVNTDNRLEDTRFRNMNMEQLNSWKQHLTEHFANEVDRTKHMCKLELQLQWKYHESILMACLTAYMMKCNQLLSQLESKETQLNALAALDSKNISKSRIIESSYLFKIEQLEAEMQCLRKRVQQKENENKVLKKKTNYLEKQLEISANFFKDVLIQMRGQVDRLTAIENLYEQLTIYMHILKLNTLKLLDERKISKIVDVNVWTKNLD